MKNKIPLFYGFYSSKKEAITGALKGSGYKDNSKIEKIINKMSKPVRCSFDEDFGNKKIMQIYNFRNPYGNKIEFGLERASWHNPPVKGYALHLIFSKKQLDKSVRDYHKENPNSALFHQ